MYGAGDDDVEKSNNEGNKKCDNTCNKDGSGSYTQFQSLVSQRSVYGINPVQARGESFVFVVNC